MCSLCLAKYRVGDVSAEFGLHGLFCPWGCQRGCKEWQWVFWYGYTSTWKWTLPTGQQTYNFCELLTRVLFEQMVLCNGGWVFCCLMFQWIIVSDPVRWVTDSGSICWSQKQIPFTDAPLFRDDESLRFELHVKKQFSNLHCFHEVTLGPASNSSSV